MKQNFTQVLPDEAATLAIGQQFAQHLPVGVTIFLHGDLGAGKTTFTRGVLQGLGHKGRVKSPTYTIVEPYNLADKMLYHFDLYRFNDEEEWEMADFRDYFNAESICMIEWPEKALNLLPKPDVEVFIHHQGQARMIEFRSTTISIETLLEQT